ncbi:MAG: HAD family phosphatase [Clostridia bacterium]|nr:HAD family phosphatase [Clostridia bacterium]
MRIKLIATDLDGTLLDGNSNLTPKSLEVMQACEERGIHFVMASGRLFEGIRLLARKANLHSPIISSNGGRVDLTPFGPAIMEDTLPHPLARKVFDILKASGLYIECYSGNTIYRSHPRLSPFLKSPEDYVPTPCIPDGEGFQQRFVDDVDRMEAEGMDRAYKFAAFSRNPEDLQEIVRQLDGLPVTINSSFPFNIEIMEKGHGKGKAIQFLQEYYQLDRDEIMTFGDSTNDLEMMLASGVPVAMGNALEEVKKAAKIIAPPNTEDGEARIIEQYVLCS